MRIVRVRDDLSIFVVARLLRTLEAVVEFFCG